MAEVAGYKYEGKISGDEFNTIIVKMTIETLGQMKPMMLTTEQRRLLDDADLHLKMLRNSLMAV